MVDHSQCEQTQCAERTHRSTNPNGVVAAASPPPRMDATASVLWCPSGRIPRVGSAVLRQPRAKNRIPVGDEKPSLPSSKIILPTTFSYTRGDGVGAEWSEGLALLLFVVCEEVRSYLDGMIQGGYYIGPNLFAACLSAAGEQQ